MATDETTRDQGDPLGLARFTSAQTAGYGRALPEIRTGEPMRCWGGWRDERTAGNPNELLAAGPCRTRSAAWKQRLQAECFGAVARRSWQVRRSGWASRGRSAAAPISAAPDAQ